MSRPAEEQKIKSWREPTWFINDTNLPCYIVERAGLYQAVQDSVNLPKAGVVALYEQILLIFL